MNRKLYDSIYQFAEDDEIDYQGLMEVARRFGGKFKTEGKLCEFKQAVDRFLTTRGMQDLDKVEAILKESGGDTGWTIFAKDQDVDHLPVNDLRRDFAAEYEKYMSKKPGSPAGGTDSKSGKRASNGKWAKDGDDASTDVTQSRGYVGKPLKNPRAN